MTKKDLNIINSLLDRTDNLPDILHLRAPALDHELTETDKEILFDTYQKLDDILKEVAAFINVKFPGRQDYIQSWNNIDFDTKIGKIKVTSTDREHIKSEWKKGLFDLKSLLKSLRNEVTLLIDHEAEMHVNVKKGAKHAIINSGNLIINKNSKIKNQKIEGSKESRWSKANVIIALVAGVVGIIGLIWTILKDPTSNQHEKLSTPLSGKIYLLDQRIDGKQVVLTFGNPDNAETFDINVTISTNNPIDTVLVTNTGTIFKAVRDFYSRLSPDKQTLNFRATKIEAGVKIIVTVIKKTTSSGNFNITGIGKLF